MSDTLQPETQQSSEPDYAARFSEAFESLFRRLRINSVKSIPQPTLVACLAYLQRYEAARISDLSVYLKISQPATTQLVNRLAKEGFVSKGYNEIDRRAVEVSLTEEGAESLRMRRRERTELLREFMQQLSPEYREDIARAIPALEALAEVVTHGENNVDGNVPGRGGDERVRQAEAGSEDDQ